MKRILQTTALMLAAILVLTIPSAQARFFDHFGFGLDSRNSAALPLNNARTIGTAADVATNAQRGFDIVHAANHLFEFRGSSHSAGEVQTLTNLRTGYYAFVIRGGDGGVGRMGNHVSAYGGSGGYVMGYFHVDATVTPTLYITVGHAGIGFTTADVVGGWPGGGRGAWNAGSGGGLTMLATSPNITTHGAHIIAVAGGGGGGGSIDLSSGAGFNAVRDNTDANSRGGHAGGAGPLYCSFNPALNGNPSDLVSYTGMRAPLRNDAAGHGRVSRGIPAGNPNNMRTVLDNNAPSSANSNGGGGAGTWLGGQRGNNFTAGGNTPGSALQGGHGSSATGHGAGGGGAGWFGGGGGERHPTGNNFRGGGGGGSSFVRHDVQPLTPGMINSVYFNPFVTLPNNEYNMYSTSRVRPNRYRRSSGPTGENYVGNEISGRLRLNDYQVHSSFQHNGFNGFAFIKYLGPLPPGNDDIIRTGWPFDATPEQAPLPSLNFSVFSDVHINVTFQILPPAWVLSEHGTIRFNAMRRALNDASNMRNDAMILLGDNTDGADRELHYFFYALGTGDNRIHPQNHFVVLGNHDLDSVGFTTGLNRHIGRYRSLTGLPINQMNPPVFENRQVNGYTFIVIGPEDVSGNHTVPGGPTAVQFMSTNQLNLLENALRNAPPNKPIFVFSHMDFGLMRYPAAETRTARSIIQQFDDVFFFFGHTHGAFNTWAHPNAANRRYTRINTPYFGNLDGRGRGIYVEVLADRVVIRQRDFAATPATWGNTHTIMLNNPRGM